MQRQFHAYGIGHSRSGTHSLAAVFGHHRSGHEPSIGPLLEVLANAHAGNLQRSQVAQFLITRDSELDLELEANHVLGLVPDLLVELFPQARFVLTIRDVYTWLDSILNHVRAVTWPRRTPWDHLRVLYYQEDRLGHRPEERVFEEFKLPPLEGYLKHWTAHLRRVTSAVPEDRLLVVKTESLSDRLDDIARFIGIPREGLDRDAAHIFRARTKLDLLRRLDPRHLKSRVDAECGEFMHAFFPDIHGPADALGWS